MEFQAPYFKFWQKIEITAPSSPKNGHFLAPLNPSLSKFDKNGIFRHWNLDKRVEFCIKIKIMYNCLP